MDVVGLNHIDAFVKRHPECRQELSELIRELETSSFATPHELSARYPSCKIPDGRTIVFKVRGNKYRLSTKVADNTQKVLILAVETHAEYNRRTLVLTVLLKRYERREFPLALPSPLAAIR